jgi:hypothetical protein
MRMRLPLIAVVLLPTTLVLAQDSIPFQGGFAAANIAQQARDDVDYQRAVTAYRFWYPTVSCEGIFNGGRQIGIKDNESMMIMAAGPRQIAFTANSDTPYGAGCLDLKNGPYVIELPQGALIGLADDHHQGWILDMGLPGPDRGKGGKHLVLPPGHKGKVPEGYFAGASSSYKVLVAIRSLPAKGDVEAAMDALRTIKIYPLSTAADPKLMKFVDVTGQGGQGGPRSVVGVGVRQRAFGPIRVEGPPVGVARSRSRERPV